MTTTSTTTPTAATVKRYDVGEYRTPEKTPEGFLRADATLSRTGVQLYRNADGSARRELRLPEEVFADEALRSFQMVPVTDEHPPVQLDATNAKEFTCGHIGDSVRRDGMYMRAPLIVTDAGLVNDMESGAKQQVSCGYDCELEMAAGVHDGEAYDAIQRNIRGNHVAILARGRAGPSVRVHLDAGDAQQMEQVEHGAQPPAPQEHQEPRAMKIKYKIDGIEYELEGVHAEQIQQALEKEAVKRTDVLGAKDAEILKLTAELAAKTKLVDQAAARADAAEAQSKKAEKERSDATDPKRFDAAVSARVELVTKAREVLGVDFKADGLDELAVRRAMLAKLAPDFKADGKSADYIGARLDAELEKFEVSSSGLANLREVVTPGGASNPGGLPAGAKGIHGDALTDKRDEFHKATEDLWTEPLTKKARNSKA